MWHPLTGPLSIDAVGRLLVPLPVVSFSGPPVLLHAGRQFAAKREYHITLAGAGIGARLLAATGSAEALSRLAGPLARSRLRAWRPLPDGWHLRRAAGADPRHPLAAEALVQSVELDDADAFCAALAAATGEPLDPPPLHVTRYVHGEPRGIGLPDRAALDRWRIAAWRMPPDPG